MDRLKTIVIPPSGPTDAKIAFFGEAPGADEKTKPFEGTAGQFFNRCLRQKGISRPSVLTDNIFEQRPPRNDVGYFFQDKGKKVLTWEGQEHIARLEVRLTLLLQRRKAAGGPNVLVALGATAMQILTGKRRINKWRGSVLPCTLVPGFKVYPTYHPSYVNRLINEPREALFGQKKKQQQNVLPLFLIDLARIVTQSESPIFEPPVRNFETSLSYNEIITRLKSLTCHFRESLTKEAIGVDIETLKGESGPILWMIGFATKPSEAFVVPFLQNFRHAFSIEQEAELLHLISLIFLNPNLLKVFQGGMYDLSVLGRYYGLRVAPGTYGDTMLCHHASYPYIRKGLEVLASIYTWERYYKDEGKVHSGKRISDLAEAVYNCKDSSVTREVWPVVVRNAKELETWEGYNRTISVIPAHLGMMLRGIRVDVEKKDKLATKFKAKAREFHEEVATVVGKEVNLNSSDQVRRLLYGYYDFPIQYHHKSKKPTADKSALQKLRKKAVGKYGSDGEETKVLAAILEFRRFDKLASTYATMEVDSDGRIHTSYGFVSTWRTASSTSPFGSGGNLQNIPTAQSEEGKLIRQLFIPDEGYELLAGDYRQAEAMVQAWEAEDLEAISGFLAGEDFHWLKAKELFGIPDSVAYDPKAPFTITGTPCTLLDLRQISRTIVYAGNYGEGPVMLQTSLAKEGFHFTFAECKNFIARFRSRSLHTMAWQRGIREKLKASRTLVSSYGRKREFMGRLNDNLYRAGYAFSPQNTVGEMLEEGAQRIWTELPEVQLLLNIHDEVLNQVPIGTSHRWIPKIKECMEREIVIKGRPLTIPVDFKGGPNWGEMEKVL